VAEALSTRINRDWFTDRRASDRGLQVTWHRENRTVVLSIWHGATCAGTFQLSIEDAARLVADLAAALSNAAETA
jgi:hypothetical protein